MKRAKHAWLVLPLLAIVWVLVSRAQGVPALGDFILFASDSLRAKGLRVLTPDGDLGANNTFKSTRPVFAPQSTIAGSTVVLDPASTCDTLLAHQALTGPLCGPPEPVTTPIVSNLAQACGAPSPFPACGGQSIIVGHKEPRTLSAGTFGDLKVFGGGHGAGNVQLGPGTYTFCNLMLGRNVNLIANGPVQINVVGTIKLGTGSFVGPGIGGITPCQVRIFSNGQSVTISRRGAVRGVLCAPNANLKITTGARLEGGFFARTIDSDRIQLSAPGCAVGTTTSTTVTSTTSSTSTSSTTSTSTTTTSTTTMGQLCGNGVVDQGEPCDPSSPAGALLCPAGQLCTQECACVTTTTQTTSSTTESTSTSTSTSSTTASASTESTSSTTTSTTTSTTEATTSSSTTTSTTQTTSSSATTSTSTTTTVTTSSTIPGTTTSTTTTTTITVTTTSTTTTITVTTTSTTTTTTTTTTSTITTSSTTTTVTTTSTTSTTGGANPSFMDFTTNLPSGICGHTYRTTDGSGPALKNLTCGGLDIGGGQSTVAEGPTPDGSANRFATSCTGSSCTLTPTLADGPGFKCTSTGCVFGTPLPIVNGTLSTCVQNIFSSPGSGTLDISTGVGLINIPLSSLTIVTGNATQPCPLCRVGTITGAPCSGSPDTPCTGVCEGSPNQGDACTSTNSSGLANDCPLPASSAAGNKCYKGTNNGGACTSNAACPGGVCSIFVGNIPVNLTPLTTGTSEIAAVNGLFCTQKRCLGGSNYGNTCTVDADCPGTTAVPRCVAQAAAQTGAFLTNVCLAGTNSGLACTVATQAVDCPGSVCRVGTGNNMCNGGANDGKGCATSTDCGGSPCVKAGTLARLIREQGAPSGSLLPIGTPHSGTLASVFCIPAASTDPNGSGQGFLINGAANLPGPGATSLPGTLKLIP